MKKITAQQAQQRHDASLPIFVFHNDSLIHIAEFAQQGKKQVSEIIAAAEVEFWVKNLNN